MAAAFHDIRNLLTNVRGSAQLGLMASAPEYKDYFSRIIAQVDSSLGWLMAGMDFLRDEAPAPVDIAEYVSGIVAEAGPTAKTNGVTLEFAAAYYPGERVEICQELLRHAINNLIVNAIQASRPGDKVLIQVTTERTRFVISVRDWGQGIRPEDGEMLFRPFHTTKKGGTGLGLFVVNYVVTHLHRGVVWYESPSGGGAQFFISLPRSG